MSRLKYYKYEVTFNNNGEVCKKTGTTIASSVDRATRNINMVYDRKILSYTVSEVDLDFPIDELVKIYDSTLVMEDREAPPRKRLPPDGKHFHFSKYLYHRALGDEDNAKIELKAYIEKCEHKTPSCLTDMACDECQHWPGCLNR